MEITTRRAMRSAVLAIVAGAALTVGMAGPATAVQPHVPATALPAAAKCAVPAKANQSVLNTLKKEGDRRKISARVRLSMYEAAWVESHANNLNCGDRDSVGVFQQRPSQGWCNPASLCRNVTHATNKYLDQAIPNAKKWPNKTAGQIAQSVQRSGYPARYDQAEATAKKLIKQSK